MRRRTLPTLALGALGAVAWLLGPDPHAPLPPLDYRTVVPATHDEWVLADDPAGDGRRVTVHGDLPSARHVAVLVPGASHDLATYDDDLGPGQIARDLWRELADQAPDSPVAVVAWLGYDTPEGFGRAVMRSDRAAVGARDLGRLGDLLHPEAHVTWLCHSYGTVVCGQAAPGSAPDDVVLLASPGTHAAAADELGAGQVWVGRAVDDPIRFTPPMQVAGFGHGPDPADAGFGAQVLDVGEAYGHSEYYAPGGSLLDDLARIALGGSPAAVTS